MLSDAKLWDELTLNLYQVIFTVADEKEVLDVTEITCGVRKLSVDS